MLLCGFKENMNYSWHCIATLSTCFGALLWAVDPDIPNSLFPPILVLSERYKWLTDSHFLCESQINTGLCAHRLMKYSKLTTLGYNNWQKVYKKCTQSWLEGMLYRGFCSEFIMHLSNRNFRIFRNFRTTRSSVNLIWCCLYCSSLNGRVWKCCMAGWVFRVLMELCRKIKLITKSGTIRSISWISSILNKVYVEWFPKETLWFFHY